MPTKDTVKLLWDCAHELTSETHTKRLLKSYYMNQCRKEARNKLQLPKEKFSVSQMCPHCSICWSESEFKLKLQPQQVAKSAKAKKLIAKLKESKATKRKGLLSKKQRRRAKWLKKRVASNVEIHCDFCQKKSVIPLETPKGRKKRSTDVEAVLEDSSISVNTKKKKKKSKIKDKTAGLKIPKELKAPKEVNVGKKSKVKELIIIDAAPPEVTTKKSTSVPTKKPVKTAKTVIASPTHLKNSNSDKNAHLTKTLKAKKKKHKSNNQKPEIKSQTQQKNSLLLLASLLKTKATKATKSSNTAQNRLSAMLK